MFSGLSSKTTEGIKVNVATTYLREESSPKHSHYVFAYKVEIINESPYSVRLNSRKWVITDALGKKRIVEGEGVVGKQPILEPGESHEYISGCNFPTPAGKMSGHYLMERIVDGSVIRVKIPSFTMVLPGLLN